MSGLLCAALLVIACVLAPCRAHSGSQDPVAEGQAALLGGDYENAYALLRPEAEDGDAKAQMYLAMMYQDGLFVSQDMETAVAWYEKAISSGSPDARYFLARLYCGQGRFEKGLQQHQASIAEGNASSLYEVGLLYYNGEGVEKDVCKAYEYFQKSIDNYDMRSAFYIARIFMDGQCETTDARNVVGYLLQASNRGDAKAQLALGLFYEFGYVVKIDKHEAIAWYRQAVNNGCETALPRLQSLIAEVGVERLRTSPK